MFGHSVALYGSSSEPKGMIICLGSAYEPQSKLLMESRTVLQWRSYANHDSKSLDAYSAPKVRRSPRRHGRRLLVRRWRGSLLRSLQPLLRSARWQFTATVNISRKPAGNGSYIKNLVGAIIKSLSIFNIALLSAIILTVAHMFEGC